MPRDLLADWPAGGQSPVPARPPRDLLEDLPKAIEPALPKPESEAKPAAPGSSWLKEQYGGFRRTFEYGVRSGAEDFYRTLDDAATIVSRVTGLPKVGIFQVLAENVAPSKEIEPQGLAEQILAALYRAPIDIATFLTVGRAVGRGPTAGLALTGAVRGGAREGPEGALREGAKGALLGGILKAAGELRPLLRVPTLAGVFGGQAAFEEGKPRDILREAAVGGIFGLMPSGRTEPWRPSERTRVPVRQEPAELGRISVREEPSGKEPEIRLRERPVEEPVERPVEKPAERPPRDLLAEEPAQEALEFARPEEQPAEVPPRKERAQREREPRGPIWVRENLPPERVRVPRERKAQEQNALAELVRPEEQAPMAEPEPQAMPPRTADTMSEAIALSSPSGRISKRERQAAQERLRVALFGEKGLLNPQPGVTPEPEALERRAAELRELASRGMSPRKFQRLASQLEQKAWEIRQAQRPGGPPQPAAVPLEPAETPQRPASIRDQIVQAYRERETKGTEGAFELGAIDSKAERLATLWDKLGQGWKEARTVAKSFRRLDPADVARQLKELSDLGFVQIAWNPKGEPYYSRKGTPRVQGLLTEEEIEAVERAARTTDRAQPEPSAIVPRAEPQPAIPEKGEIRLPQSVRDAYIEAQLSAHKPAAETGKPMRVVLSGGPPGAGKSAATKAFGLRKDDFVVADPDLHKKNLGFEDRAADFHEESSTINKQLVDRALDRGVNLLYDSLLSNYPLAEKLISEARDRGAKVFIAFTHIDPMTSQVRSELRYRKHLMGLSEAEGASPRRIPVEASVKGYNASLPTFIELYKRFGSDPEISWSLVDNNVDGRPPKPVFAKEGGKLHVFDEKEFANLMGTEYTTNGKTGEDLRYVRKDKATSDEIRKARGEIERRVDDQLNAGGRAPSGRGSLAVQVPLGSAASEPRTVRSEQEEVRQEVKPAPEAISERPSKSTPEAAPTKSVLGDETSIKNPEGEDPARYALVDADALVPSHDMREAFQARLDSIIGTESPPPAPVGLHIRPVAASSSGTSTGGVPATPARVAAARGLHKALGSETTVVGLARKALEFARSAGRVYRALPPETTKEVPALKEGNKLTTFSKKVSFRQTLEQLRQLRADYEVAQTNAVRLFRGLTRDLHPEDVPLFYDAVVSSDLAYEAGRRSIDQMPFGLTKDEALKWKQDVVKAVESNPRVKEALERRRRAYKAIADELIDAKILKEEQIYELDENGDRVRMKNEDYLHHQVLQYANFEVGPFGKGKKVQKPHPGYAKARSLKSTLDYNTDVFEADVMHMTRALYDIRRARRFESLMEEHDIADYLKALAKRTSVKDWKELIPDGYEVRQYDPGRTFFHAESLPEKIVREILEGPGATVLPGDLRSLLAVGRKNREYVIPSELVETFEAMTRPQEYGPIKKAARALTTVWKKSVLLLPRRIVRYNWQNMIGDLDAAIAGAPAILKEIKSSARDLYSFYHGTTAPKDVQDAFERAVLSSTLTFEEIPSVSDLRVFDNIPETPGRRDWNLLSRYMRTAGRWTTYRENLLRLASYRYFLKRFEAGDYSNIGASVREDVMSLPDVKDRAAKVARELIGDYGAISEIGRDLRQSAIPFYSWLEVNLRRYKRLIENSFTESRLQGTQTAARLSALVGARASAKMLSAWVKMLFLTSAVHLYNQLTASESEATLNDYDRRRLHINLTPFYRMLGGDPDKTVILRGQSAFGDLLEWIGVNDVVASLDDWKRGTYGAKDAAKDILKAPVNKIVGALNPFYRALYEALTGVRLFPDVTRPGYTKGTLGTRLPLAVAEMFTLGEEWKALTHVLPGLEPIPMRNYAENWSQAVFTSKDVDEQAYSYIQDRKARYLEQHGLGGRAVSNSPRSIALYNYRKARLYKDLEAERYWMQKLIHMTGNPSEALESIKRSGEYLRPLGGLKKEGAGPGSVLDFKYHYLDANERKLLWYAERYYFRTAK